jgi:predicted MFS family arabinose efflux permease
MTTQALNRTEELGWGALAALLGGRFVLNTAFRIVYPLLALLATQLGVDLRTASLLITIQVGVTLLSPLAGRLADARGDRFAMLAGLAIFCVGALVCALANSFGLFVLGYSLIGLGSTLYIPAMQLYASARSTYAQRGRILGLLETSWALSALIGVTGLTVLVEAQGALSGAYWLLFGMGAAGFIATALLTTARTPAQSTSLHRPADTGRIIAQRGVLPALGFIVLQLLAIELIFVVYAAWLQADFQASTAQLGLVFGMLGIMELGGSVGAALFTDRVGKRRAVLVGFSVMTLTVLLMPLTAGRWELFLAVFLLFGLAFEFAIVSIFPLVSGLVREGRGTVIALAITMVGLGRIIGSLVGPRLFESFGFGANALLAGATALAGIIIGLIWMHEGRE